jgi:2-amino-4-hydroxy-6-hydroxymethyldihydropteridine diphosphokinase
MGDSHESHQKGIVVIDIDLLAYGSQQFKADDWKRSYIKELAEEF